MSVRGRFLLVSSLLLWEKNTQQKQADRVNCRTIVPWRRGKHSRFHTTNIHKILFWPFILLLGYFLSLCPGLKWDTDWMKTVFDFFNLCEFLSMLGGKCSPALCLSTRKSILASDKNLVCDSARAPALSFIDGEWLIGLTVLAGFLPLESPTSVHALVPDYT